MKCQICGRPPTKVARCESCGEIAAAFCDGTVCQPDLWRTGPQEPESSIPLMNFRCEFCANIELELQALPQVLRSPAAAGKLFGFIGTYLMHGYEAPPDSGAGYSFALAHFLKTMAPEAVGWAYLANVHNSDPKAHANRAPVAMKISHREAMSTMISIDFAVRWVNTWLKGVLPENVGRVPNRFYCTAMVLSGANAHVTNVPNSVGIPDLLQGQGNYSSRTTKVEIDGVVSYMRDRKIQESIGFPTFSVWDCNCFHNSGYIMGKYALDSAFPLTTKVNPPVLIVNIDQHSDAGSKTQTIISSDRWGISLVENYPNSAYLSISSGGSGTGHQIETHYRKGDAKPARVGGIAIGQAGHKFTRTHLDQLFGDDAGLRKAARTALKEYWVYVLELIFGTDGGTPDHFEFVYLTIDRDCMKDNQNQWGDGKAILADYTEVNKLADGVLGTLVSTGTRVVGFDVTGLPEDHTKLTCNSSKTDKPNASAILADVKQELAAFQATFHKHLHLG
jgi:hypothetical protein